MKQSNTIQSNTVRERFFKDGRKFSFLQERAKFMENLTAIQANAERLTFLVQSLTQLKNETESVSQEVKTLKVDINAFARALASNRCLSGRNHRRR